MVQAGAGPPSGQQRSPAKEAQPKGGLIVEAREYLRQIRAQQSNTKTVGATLSTPGNIAGASGQYATTSTELARTYPELVRTFVSFLGKVASEFDRVHDIHRAVEVGSVDAVISAEEIRPRIIAAIEATATP